MGKIHFALLIAIVLLCSPVCAREYWYHGSKDAPLWVTPKTDRKPWHDELDKAYALQKQQSSSFLPNAKVDPAQKEAIDREVEDHYKKAIALSVAAGAFKDAGRAEYEWAVELKLQQRKTEAIDAFLKSISYQKKADPSDTVLVGDCYIQMGQQKEQYDKKNLGIDDARRAYDIYSKLLPADDVKLEWPVSMLKMYAATPAEAMPMARQAIEILKKVDPDHEGLIGTLMYTLAMELGNAGKVDEAIKEAEEALAWCRKEPGFYGQSTVIEDSIEHWRRQKMGIEPSWDVQYGGRFAGRNPRSRPANPNPPGIANLPGRGGSSRHRPEPATPATPPPPAASGEGGTRYFVAGKEVSKNKYDAVALSNEGCELLQKHQLKPALEKLTQALTLDPDYAQTHANLGLVLSKLGQKDSAISHLTQAVRLAPDVAAPLGMLASTYQSNGQLDNAVEAYKTYLERFPDENDVVVVKALVHDLTEVNKKQKAVESSHSAAELADNYLPYCMPHGKVRWSSTIKVYLAPIRTLHGYQPSFQGVLKQCFDDWLAKSGNHLSFKFVPNRSESDVDCFFTNDFSQVSSPAEGGETQEHFDKTGHFKHCTIILLTEQAGSTITPTDNDVRGVSLHEIGHAVGLMGHSPKPDDIMYCTAPDNTEIKRPELTERDLKTLTKLYSD